MSIFALMLALVWSISGTAWAQSPPPDDNGDPMSTEAPPENGSVDENGINLLTGKFSFGQNLLSIGDGALSYAVSSNGTEWRDNFIGTLNEDSGTYFASFGGGTDSFDALDTYNDNGAKLTQSGNLYSYTTRDGTVAEFDTAFAGTYPHEAGLARLTNVTFPNGESYAYEYDYYTEDMDGDGIDDDVYDLISVTTNTGFQFRHPAAGGTSKMINMGTDYCDPATAGECSGLTQSWPEPLASATYTGTTTAKTFTTPGGVTVSHVIDATGRVTSVTRAGSTWTYAYVLFGPTTISTVTNPEGNDRVYTFINATGLLSSLKNELNETTIFIYDSLGRLSRTTYPEGNYVDYTYDARSNVTEIRQVAKSGSGEADIVATASYPATCADPKTCNKPTATIDPLGNQTDYTYDSDHGGILTVTAPAPEAGAARPQVIFSYTQKYAWYKNAGGAIVQSATPVWKLFRQRRCPTASSCVGAADERVTSQFYQAGSASASSNLLLTLTKTGAGDGSLFTRSDNAYDLFGNLQSIDSPQQGTNDKIFYHRDENGRVLGVVTPDPDGAGALNNRAVRYTYNTDNQITQTETGTVTDYTLATFQNSFVVLQKQTTDYDSHGRVIEQRAMNGANTEAVAQVIYDTIGRPSCVATRMNPATFGSLPTSACTLATEGTFGPDRITKTSYDAVSRVDALTTAFGTSAAKTETTSYNANGTQSLVIDGEGNRTTYHYDGHDRVVRVRYPDPDNGAVSSTTDDEWLTYDAASRVTSKRQRDNQLVSTSFDNLGRLTNIDTPGGAFNDVAYSYDLLGQTLSVAGNGQNLTYAYDSLGRTTAETGPLGTVSYGYDLIGTTRTAGFLEKVTYPDGFFVNYDYDQSGAMTTVRENGATSGVGVLATYAYDDLGRRASVTRGNGVTTSVGFDAVGRLTSLDNDLSGTVSDLNVTFAHNPAGQIISKANTNDIYDPVVSYGTTISTVNDLNQLLEEGANILSHDARGNISSDGGRTFGYDIFNRLTSVTGTASATLAYDPIGRLAEVTGSATTKFAYSGLQAIAEYDGSDTLLRKYVFGASLDEPLVWYEGSGTSDRRWLVTDYLGSVIAVTDETGAATHTNTYDAYGVPQAGNTGRFQYTGQMWLEEAGLYHYKARAYDPELGRFLQTDPIGYGGGLNMYAYVGGDPVNFTDPLGLLPCAPNEICVTAKPRRTCQTDPLACRSFINQFILDQLALTRQLGLAAAGLGDGEGGDVASGSDNDRCNTLLLQVANTLRFGTSLLLYANSNLFVTSGLGLLARVPGAGDVFKSSAQAFPYLLAADAAASVLQGLALDGIRGGRQAGSRYVLEFGSSQAMRRFGPLGKLADDVLNSRDMVLRSMAVPELNQKSCGDAP